MKFLNKKISLGISMTISLIIATVTFPIGYSLATKKISKVVAFNQEKQQMYSKLSEIDSIIRHESVLDINEDHLNNNISQGYVLGLNSDHCRYYSKEDFKKRLDKGKNLQEPIFSENITENTGYIQINHLGADSAKNFINAVNEFINININNLIIDIREASYGEIANASKILEYLISEGNLISSINKKRETEEICKGSSKLSNMRIITIADGNTKGIPELIVSALKDDNKSKIIGTTTAGEAFREKIVELIDGSAISYPDAHYVTQSGEIFYKKGINPDIECALDQEKYELFKKNELTYDDDEAIQEALKLF